MRGFALSEGKQLRDKETKKVKGQGTTEAYEEWQIRTPRKRVGERLKRSEVQA